jgi:hypothetical protein
MRPAVCPPLNPLSSFTSCCGPVGWSHPSPGELLPRLALFATRPIAAGEELAFGYGGGGGGGGGGEADQGAGGSDGRRGKSVHPRGQAAGGGASRAGVPCACGTKACTGWLPREDV